MVLINNKKGNTTLLVIVIITFFIVLSLSLSKLMNEQINIISNIERANLAYYASETGIEKSMYYMNRIEMDPNIFNSGISYNSGSLNNGSSYKCSVISIFPIKLPLILDGESYSTIIFKRPVQDKIQSVIISWTGNGYERARIIWERYDQDGHLEQTYFNNLYNHSASPIILNLHFSSNPHYNQYKLTIIAENGDLRDVVLSFNDRMNGRGVLVNTESAYELKCIGNYYKNDQIINTSVKRGYNL